MLGQFYPGASVVHRLDPRTKILATTIFILVTFSLRGLIGYATVLLCVAVIVTASRLPVPLVVRSLRPLLILLLLTVIIHAFSSGREGSILWRWGPLAITDEGLILGLKMGSRLALLILGSSLLTLTTTPIELTDGMERLLRPLQRIGLPVHELAMMMTIALRFIPILLGEVEQIIKAQMARGADISSSNLIQRVRHLVPILVPLFISAFRRADELATAMEARCYRGGYGRSRYRELHWQSKDVWASLIVVSVAVLIVWLDR